MRYDAPPPAVVTPAVVTWHLIKNRIFHTTSAAVLQCFYLPYSREPQSLPLHPTSHRQLPPAPWSSPTPVGGAKHSVSTPRGGLSTQRPWSEQRCCAQSSRCAMQASITCPPRPRRKPSTTPQRGQMGVRHPSSGLHKQVSSPLPHRITPSAPSPAGTWIVAANPSRSTM